VCALVCVCMCVCVCVCVGYFTAAPKLPWRSFLAPGAAAPGAGRCGGGWLNVECPFLFSERRSMSSSELSVVSPSSYLPRCYIRTSAQHTRWNPSIPESRGAAKPPLRAGGGGGETERLERLTGACGGWRRKSSRWCRGTLSWASSHLVPPRGSSCAAHTATQTRQHIPTGTNTPTHMVRTNTKGTARQHNENIRNTADKYTPRRLRPPDTRHTPQALRHMTHDTRHIVDTRHTTHH